MLRVGSSGKGSEKMGAQPYHDRDGFIWYNGALVPWREAKLHVLSHGLHYASAVFEGERAYGGAIFKLTEHSQRLAFSAQQLGFELPFSVDAIDRACDEVLRANGITDGYVRPIAWRGSEMMGVSAQSSTIQVAIAAWEWGAYFGEEARQKGIRTRNLVNRTDRTRAGARWCSMMRVNSARTRSLPAAPASS